MPNDTGLTWRQPGEPLTLTLTGGKTMGNRANVVFTDGKKNFSPAIYLHWNGGPESIYAFLAEMDRRMIRGHDVMYESARFCHIVGDFMDQKTITGLSLRITNGPKSDNPADFAKVFTDPGNNGFYLVERTQAGNGKFNTKVWRFLELENGKGIKELTEAEVEAERQEAMKSDYIPDIAATFLKITVGKEIEK
jgi:hypothetical protein